MFKLEKKDYKNIALLLVFFVAVVIIYIFPDKYFGSTIDWQNQHFTLPEYFRNRFYETGQLFPSFSKELSGGVNIYYFAYYGLGSPFLYLSYLFPFICMRTFIIGINIFSVAISIYLFYVWVRSRYNAKISFILGFLFTTSSPLIFHAHRHFMFVDYIPFLLLALIFVKKYMEQKGKLWPIAIMSYLIISTSFYYCVGSYLAIGMYAVILYLRECKKFSFKELICSIWKIVLAVIIGTLIDGIVLLPTAFALLGGRTVGNGSFDYTSLIPQIKAEYIFYGNYSMGLPVLFIFASFAEWFRRKKDNIFVFIVVGIMMVLPIITYLFNGGLYGDGKALIPFMPIGIMVMGDYIDDIYKKKTYLDVVAKAGLIICILIAAFTFGQVEFYAHILETTMFLGGYLAYRKNKNAVRVIAPVFISVTAICLSINIYDKAVKINTKNDKEIEQVSSIIDEINEEEYVRYNINRSKFEDVNKVYDIGAAVLTAYSSSENQNYKNFYFNVMGNEVPYRNNAILPSSYNEMFNLYMGVRYFISNDITLAGYELISEDGYKIYKNKDAYAIAYTNGSIMKKTDYEKLEYPYSLEAIMKYEVVDDEIADKYGMDTMQITDAFITQIDVQDNLLEDIYISYDCITKTKDGYNVDIPKNVNSVNATYKIREKYKSQIEGKVLILMMDMDNFVENKKDEADTKIIINKVRNSLTAPSWRYHNNNYTFKYFLDMTKDIDKLDIKLIGRKFRIKNIRAYIVDYDMIREYDKNHGNVTFVNDKTQGDMLEGTFNDVTGDMMHITIPYDEGFDILIDGKQTEYFMVDEGFIGVNIKDKLDDKKEHSLKIIFTAKGIEEGKIISIVGVMMLMVLVIIEIHGGRKRWKNSK